MYAIFKIFFKTLSLKSPHGELTIKFVLYCIVLYRICIVCKSNIDSLLILPGAQGQMSHTPYPLSQGQLTNWLLKITPWQFSGLAG